MAKPAEGVSYTRPTSQVDLEQRLADNFRSDAGSSPLDSDDKAVNPTEQSDQFAVEGNDTDAYVNVSEEYRTYANDTEKPYAFEGVEGDAVAFQLDGQFAVGQDAPAEVVTTQGGGSNFETVTTHESGADLQPNVVDREKVAEAVSKDDAQGETPPAIQQKVETITVDPKSS